MESTSNDSKRNAPSITTVYGDTPPPPKGWCAYQDDADRRQGLRRPAEFDRGLS